MIDQKIVLMSVLLKIIIPAQFSIAFQNSKNLIRSESVAIPGIQKGQESAITALPAQTLSNTKNLRHYKVFRLFQTKY